MKESRLKLDKGELFVAAVQEEILKVKQRPVDNRQLSSAINQMSRLKSAQGIDGESYLKALAEVLSHFG